MQQRNYPKLFGILGAGLALVYLGFTILAPLSSGQPVPWQHQAWRLLVLAPFFAVFGALVGTGIGLIIAGILKKK